MAAGTVSVTMGVMNPLLGKLTTLMGDEYKKLKGVRKEVSFLKDELSAMKAALENLELMDKLKPHTKNWRDHVREMAYDMENCIDDFMRDLGGADANAGFFKKTARRLKTLRARHRIAGQIEDLKALALEANERRARYKIDDCVSSSSVSVPVDPRVSAIYKEAAGLVGINGPREELVSWLTNTNKKVKVVSIVGFGGLGKTTLAKQVYDEIGGQFSCKAFISISQRPDMTSLLNGLHFDLGMGESSRTSVQDIIDILREHLAHERYLIVIDDLWDQSVWNIINCAFGEDGNGGRVIVTTRVDDVALYACRNRHECIYRMKPLGEQDSRRLFFNRVFESEDGCPPQLKEVSAEILKKCGGLPLAIITIASLLASCQARSRKEWESIRNCLGAKFVSKPTLQEMRSILNLSYMHLPLHLRPCFLYLGMYPEDREIKRDDLVRQWIAEGFVNHLHGSDLEDVANSYFNELINRSMIQPGRSMYGEVVSCRIHDMILDLILSKCAEDNFMSVAHNYEDMERLHGYEYKVRRLSLSSSTGGGTSGTTATSLSQVRSFAQFRQSKYTPPLLLFKYLRVLVYEVPGWAPLMVDITAVGQLFRLRYLRVSAGHDNIIELPNEIQKLVHLDTLELDCPLARSIPSNIVHLPRLCHLILEQDEMLPGGIGDMRSLRTLHCFDPCCGSLKDVESLGELTNLRNLMICKGDNWDNSRINALVSSIRKLHKLKYLWVCGDSTFEDKNDLLASSWDPPPLDMEELELPSYLFFKFPKWIGDLHCLRNLCLRFKEVSAYDFHVLGELPSLVYLRYIVEHIPKDRATIVVMGLFLVLEHLEFCSSGDIAACLVFEIGVMPKLRKLDLYLSECDLRSATPVGMEHLLSLEKIHVFMTFMFGGSKQVKRDAESAFRNAAQMHPRRPSVAVKLIGFRSASSVT